MGRLEVSFLDIPFKNPLLAASGTYGFGRDYERYYDPAILGGICLKGLTLNPRAGNEGIRLWETPMGLLNSVGLQNPGVAEFIEKIYPDVSKIDTNIIINLGGSDTEDYLKSLELLNAIDFAFIELNISCPNVKAGGMSFGVDPDRTYDLIKACKKVSRHKIVAKLTPNVTDIAEIAVAAQEAGADGLSLINTVQGMAIDVDREKIVFENTFAGLSGPAIRPIALAKVYQAAQAVDIPVIGCGGIASGKDAMEFILAGASLVEIGTMNFVDPTAPVRILREMEDYCYRRERKIEDFIGNVQS